MAKQTFTTGQVLTAAQMTSLQQTAMGGGAPVVKTASYVLTAADAGTVIQMNSGSSTTITVNTSLFSAGDSVQIQNIGAGTCTITAGTATVTTAGSLALSQWEGGFLYFTSASAAIFFDVVQSSGLTNPMTTTGDIIYSSSGSTPARLGIGSTGNVLTVAGGVPSWAAASGGNLDLSQLATGSLSGTNVSLGSLTQDFFLLYITGANVLPSIRLNNNSGANYVANTYRLTSTFDSWGGTDRWDLGTGAYSSSSNTWYITIQNGKASGMHTVNYWGYYNSSSAAIGGGYFTNETQITQINIVSTGSSFSAGTYTLIGG